MALTSFSGPVESNNGFQQGGVPMPTIGNTAAQLTASGAIPAGKQCIELNHASVAIAATLTQAPAGFVAVANTSASGTAAHTVTLTNGSWNGTNKVLTTNGPLKNALFYFDSAGRGTIIWNGTAAAGVTFSG